jgi:DNA-binding CsgD family transcriptional regulator
VATHLEERRRRTAFGAIERECARDLSPDELLARVAERLVSAVACTADGWMLLDPQTLMFTGGIRPGRPLEVLGRLMHNEFAQRDVIKFRALARAPRPVGTLWQATGGHPERSCRYRRILAPLDGGDELRAVFRAGATCWGGLSLVRAAGDEPFSEADAALVEAASRPVATALRRCVTRALSPSAATGPAEVLILDGDDAVVSQTPDAARLLSLAGQENRTPLPLPVTVYSVAHRARAIAADHADGPPATARMRRPSGEWLSVDAAPLEDPRWVAVVVQPARAAQLAPLVLAASGLTARQRQIARMLLRGDATELIAQHLVISRHTLRDHVKAIYAKFGVTGRPEFTALLLHEEEIPHQGDSGRDDLRPA